MNPMIAITALVAMIAPSPAEEITWAKDYKSAVKASQGKKLIMVDFYTEW